MQELCVELAATGQDRLFLLACIGGLVVMALILLKVARRQRPALLVSGLLLVAGLFSTPTSHIAMAQSSDCLPSTSASPGGEPAAMQLINDSRVLGLGQPAVLRILQNDIPPAESSFNQQTIRLLGTTHSFDPQQFPIVDPSSDADPADDSTWGDDWEHYLGYWYVHGNGLVVIYLNDSDDFGGTAPDGSTFSIDYLVDTEEGETPSTPATITVTIRDPMTYTTNIFAEDDQIDIDMCNPNNDILNITDNDYANPGTLQPATIDLDPSAPGIQKQYTYYATPSDPIVFSVDAAGMLSVDVSGMDSIYTSPGSYVLYTVRDSLGNTATATIFVNGLLGCG